MQTKDWATVENFSRFVAGMNGGKDGGTHGCLPGFASYEEIEGEIEYSDTEVNILMLNAQLRPTAGVACELCGEYVDRYGRCACDY